MILLNGNVTLLLFLLLIEKIIFTCACKFQIYNNLKNYIFGTTIAKDF